MSAAGATPAHAGFTVRGLPQILEFLVHGLGFTLESIGPPKVPGVLGRIVGVPSADANIAYVRLAGLMLELLEYTSPPSEPLPARRPHEPGFAHVALYVDDVRVVVERAARYGFVPSGEIVEVPAGLRAGKRTAYLANADGFTVEIMDS